MGIVEWDGEGGRGSVLESNRERGIRERGIRERGKGKEDKGRVTE